MRGALLLLLLASCGGISFDDYPGELVDAQCEYQVRCRVAETTADCRAAHERTAVTQPSLAAAVDAGKVRYDEVAAQGCIDAYDALSCDETQLAPGALEACSSVFEGQLEIGEACGFDRECRSDRCITSDCTDQCCPGTCAQQVALPQVGDACTSICADSAYCGVDAICHALLPAGAACDNVSLCQGALYCAGLSSGGSGVCTALPHEGEACESQCAETSSICVLGTCSAAGFPGDSCAAANACADLYTCSDGVCSHYPTRAMPCTIRCSDDSFCDAGTCVAQKADGGDCIYPDDCASHFCSTGGICSSPPLCI